MSFPMNRTTRGKPLPPLTLRGVLRAWVKANSNPWAVFFIVVAGLLVLLGVLDTGY